MLQKIHIILWTGKTATPPTSGKKCNLRLAVIAKSGYDAACASCTAATARAGSVCQLLDSPLYISKGFICTNLLIVIVIEHPSVELAAACWAADEAPPKAQWTWLFV